MSAKDRRADFPTFTNIITVAQYKLKTTATFTDKPFVDDLSADVDTVHCPSPLTENCPEATTGQLVPTVEGRAFGPRS